MILTGKETIEKIKHTIEYVRFKYLHTDGALFQCVKSTLEECRLERNNWIEKGYLLSEWQIVYNIQSGERLVVINPKLKGYVVLIEIETACILSIRRDFFFRKYDFFGMKNVSEIADIAEAYALILKAYHLQFNMKK